MQVRIPILERIWRVNSSLTLAEPLTPGEVFEKLDPLFHVKESGATSVEINGPTLTYAKKNPAAQDKFSTFTSGTLTVEEAEEGTRLSYNLGSTALFLCFLAPLFFLAFAQLASFLNEIEGPAVAAEKAEREKEEEEKAKEPIELHWIDKMLGAPAPEQPGEKEEAEKKEGREGDEEEEPQGNHSPETAYVIAGVFFVIFCVGRVLEPYLLKRTLRAHLSPLEEVQGNEPNTELETGAKLASPGGGPETT